MALAFLGIEISLMFCKHCFHQSKALFTLDCLPIYPAFFFFLIVDEWNPFFLGSREAMYPTVLKTSSLIVVELTA